MLKNKLLQKFSGHQESILDGVCLLKSKVLGLKLLSKLTSLRIFLLELLEVYRVSISQKCYGWEGTSFIDLTINTPTSMK